MRTSWLAPAGAVAAVIVLAACGGSSSGSGGASGGSGGSASPAAAAQSTSLKTAKIGSATVLTNSQGYTLYWFALDTATTSKCNSSCTHYWPPVKGPATAGSGVTGKLTVITRSDGVKQAVYNGHPLYTYVGDSKPGEATGNGLNLSGGIWHEVVVSGSASKKSGGGGGYGSGY